MSDLLAAKAEKVIKHEVELIERSAFPDPTLGRGYVEMAYALGLLTDDTHAYWNRRMDLTAMNRRQQLRAARNKEIIGATP